MRSEALAAIAKAEKILLDIYGPSHALYLDYLFTMTQMSFDIEFDKNEVEQNMQKHLALSKSVNQRKVT
jgi:hypothetical protein